MLWRRALPFVAVFSFILQIGCQPQRATSPQGGIEVNQLAAALNMELQNEGSFAHLTNSGNAVYIVTEPQKRIYVNGKELDPQLSENIYLAGDRLMVPETLPGVIRPLLKDAPAVSAPAPRAPWSGGKVSGTIVLDPGHGGSDPGTMQNGLREKNINLAVARVAAEILRDRGVKVVMTRTGDTFPSLDDRVAIANRTKPNLFVSIHGNSLPNKSYRGYTVYTAEGASAASKQASAVIFDSMAGTGLGNRGQDTAKYIVLMDTKCPAVLVEMGCLSNAREATLLADSDFQQKIAEAIADGICAYLQK